MVLLYRISKTQHIKDLSGEAVRPPKGFSNNLNGGNLRNGFASPRRRKTQGNAHRGEPDGAYKSCGKPTGTAPPQRNCFTASP